MRRFKVLYVIGVLGLCGPLISEYPHAKLPPEITEIEESEVVIQKHIDGNEYEVTYWYNQVNFLLRVVELECHIGGKGSLSSSLMITHADGTVT